MNQKRINTILLSDSEINHLICSSKKDEFIIEGGSHYSYNSFDKLSLDNALKEIAQSIKNNKLTKLNIVHDHVLKYLSILNQTETQNLRLEVLNRFKTTFDIALHEYYIDFETYNFKNMNIFFVAGINKSFFDPILRIFRSKNYKLLFLEVDVIALKRLMSLKYKNEVIMNIHMRDDRTIFSVIYNNILFAFRELSFGFINIMNNINNKEKIDFENECTKEAFDKLTIEIQRTIDFYNSQIRNEPISKLVLTGKLINITNIDKFLSQLFIIKTDKFNPLKQFLINSDVKIIENMTYLTEVLGTSLREI